VNSAALSKLIDKAPEIIQEAAKSPLGLFALMIIGLSVLATIFFAKASVRVRVWMFVLMFAGVALFGATMVRTAPPILDSTASDRTTTLEQDIRGHLRDGYYEDALHEAEKLCTLRPQSSAAFRLKGEAHFKLNENQSALDAFAAAAKLDPKSSVAAFDEGAALAAMGQYTSAKRIFEQLRDADPGDMSIQYSLASVALLSGDYAAAKNGYEVVYNSRAKQKAASAIGLGLSEALGGKTPDSLEPALRHMRQALCLEPNLRGVFLGEPPEDPTQNYDGYVHLLDGLKKFSAYNQFLENVREGKECM